MPTTVISDTFESYAFGSLVAPWAGSGPTSIATAQAHAGTNSLAVGSGGSASTATRSLGTTLSKWILDCWLWIHASGGTTGQYVVLRVPGTTAGIALNIAASGAGQVFAPGGTVFFTFTGVATGTWVHAILTVSQAATGGTISLTIDGTSKGTFTGDTRDTAGNATVGELAAIGAGIGPSPPAEFYLDDLVVSDNTAVTALWASQVLSEVWRSAGQLAVSQALAETWITRTPPTAAVVSQALAETWVSAAAPTSKLIVSQALAEIWLGASLAAKDYRVSAGVV